MILELFESAACCHGGLSKKEAELERQRITNILSRLKEKGIEIPRYNMADSPVEFATNVEVHRLLYAKGMRVLPLMTFQNKVVVSGRYPSKDELIKYLGLPDWVLSIE